ncbi:hypothetical protein RJT34_21779 [Clitoria ternatea]|uniref:Aladin n=1 Tax=Clitoria ternatea TaxID=43366 RepID=A0AAN9P6S5_CLITE
MASFPPPGSFTLCEVNRDLITVDAISDDRANQTYGKILGLVFSPVPFQPLENDGSEPEGATVTTTIAGESVPRKGPVALVQGLINQCLTRLFYPNDVRLLPEVDLQGVSWHPNKHIIAFISGPIQVLIRDYQDSEGKEPIILGNELQRDVRVLEWRPNGGRMLAVGCKSGICMWAASYPGNAASVRSGAASFLGSLSRGSGNRYILVDFLHAQYDEHVSALTWTSASYESSSFTVWDFAQAPCGSYLAVVVVDQFESRLTRAQSRCHGSLIVGNCGKLRHGSFPSPKLCRVGTPIRRGLGGISILKWSPTGDYFFASKFDGTFYLWETNTWTSEQWSSTSGFVKGATWDPDGRMILLAFSESSTLGSVHFASKPPSLDAHLLPVDLPEILSLSGSRDQWFNEMDQRFNKSVDQILDISGLIADSAWSYYQFLGIEKVAWDNSGERLAVSFKGGDDMYSGLIAIYDTRRTPLISTSLIGFIRGPGDDPKPISFSFHGKFKQGPLLSVHTFEALYYVIFLFCSAGAVGFVALTPCYFDLTCFHNEAAILLVVYRFKQADFNVGVIFFKCFGITLWFPP